ncbi:tetrapyrrole methylase [Peptoniphilus sp. HMSC075B08]|uniref:SAM-dependent methyltransferase n=1 Tax=Peptoniphilus sp. HMSC075B08 TaxID=1739525 RepID=UPI0008A62039|nr:SAM-dependent methyltransferase [Peptoniphilus sp. HMSC075B08]OFO62702.1 tetrapyrrole methylase [Peptoniphilus sp. HMSC075B08]
MINVVGLGSTSSRDLTLEAVKIMKNGNKNFLRTDRHEALSFFEENKIKYESFDYLYNEMESFDEVYNKIVEILLEEAKDKDINYFVPGTPLVAEKTVRLLIDEEADINIVNGISFIEPVLAGVGRDAVDGLLFLDSDAKKFDFDTRRDTLITQVYNKRIASDLSLLLQEVYKEEDMAYVIRNAGLDDEIVRKVEIYKLPRIDDYNHQSCIYIPRTSGKNLPMIMDRLEDILEKEDIYLDDECFEKIKKLLIEKSEDLSMDYENETDILILSILLLLLKDREGLVDFREIYDEIYKKLDKIAIFLK